MRGGAADGDGAGSPEVEGFTPPSMEAFTPDASPGPEGQLETTAGESAPRESLLESETFLADQIQEQGVNRNEPPPAFEPPPALQTGQQNDHSISPSIGPDLLSTLNTLGQVRPASSTPPTNGATADPRLKRRKISHKPADMDDEIFGTGNGVEIDDEVAAMLGAQ
ncbi:hypothetical protein H2203_004649 [Taxawa tesnikishii (nom. ined.)]|nr:hypothetical protein H2203_004649 [Dothideales sp. JES 119]